MRARARGTRAALWYRAERECARGTDQQRGARPADTAPHGLQQLASGTHGARRADSCAAAVPEQLSAGGDYAAGHRYWQERQRSESGAEEELGHYVHTQKDKRTKIRVMPTHHCMAELSKSKL